MGLKYFATVHDVTVRVDGKDKLVTKGDAVPDAIEIPVRDALVRMGLLTATEAPHRGSDDDTATVPSVVTVDTARLPADRDVRAVWEAFGAQALGMTVADAKSFKTKDELVAEVTARFNAANTVDTGTEATTAASIDTDGGGHEDDASTAPE